MTERRVTAKKAKKILFLQGATNSLFENIASRLGQLGHSVSRIHFSVGDGLFWQGGAVTKYVAPFADWPAFIEAFLEKNAITDILLLGEQRPYHSIAIEKAKARGIQVYVTDFGYIRPDWVIIERDGMNAESRFPRDPAAIMKLAAGLPPVDKRLHYRDSFFKQAIWDMAYHLSQVYWPFAFPHYQRHTLVHPFLVYPGIGLRLLFSPLSHWRARRALAQVRAQRYFVFAMQTEDDYSLRAYSDFPDLDTPMRETIISFAKHAPAESQLIFKIHPLDPGLKRWRSRIAKMAVDAGVSGRVQFIDGGDLDAILQASAGLVTVNSTVGVRAIELGCPLIVLGKAIYRVEGLTFEAPLDQFWREATPPDATLADAFIRAIAATLHVRGSMYNTEGIKAAAEGMAYRLHHDLVNVPIAEVNRGEALKLCD